MTVGLALPVSGRVARTYLSGTLTFIAYSLLPVIAYSLLHAADCIIVLAHSLGNGGHAKCGKHHRDAENYFLHIRDSLI